MVQFSESRVVLQKVIANDEHWMRRALALAAQAAAQDEVPVGAVLVSDAGELLGEGYNQPIARADPTAHAEIMALRAAALQQGNYRLPNTTLYVTVEPCTMCVGAIIHARVARLVFAATEPKAGAVVSQFQLLDSAAYNHKCSYTQNLLADEARGLMSGFFKARRQSRED